MNIIIVGTGFSGSILARKIAEDLGCKVTVIEKRDHIGGNMYDFVDDNGILIQKYGPHFINTDNYWIIKYLSHYSKLVPYDCQLKTVLDGKIMNLPYNFTTLKQ
jgi:UDP-galactopyranose mutase